MGFHFLDLPPEIQTGVLHHVHPPDLRTILDISEFYPLLRDNLSFLEFTSDFPDDDHNYEPAPYYADVHSYGSYNSTDLSDPQSLDEVIQAHPRNKIILLELYYATRDKLTITKKLLELITSLCRNNTVHLVYHCNSNTGLFLNNKNIDTIANLKCIINSLNFPNNVNLILHSIGDQYRLEYKSFDSQVYFPRIYFMGNSSVESVELYANKSCKLNELQCFGSNVKSIYLNRPTNEELRNCDFDFTAQTLRISGDPSGIDQSTYSIFNKLVPSPTSIHLHEITFLQNIRLTNCEKLEISLKHKSGEKYGVHGLIALRLFNFELRSDPALNDELIFQDILMPNLQVALFLEKRGNNGGNRTPRMPRGLTETCPNVHIESLRLGNIKILKCQNLVLMDKVFDEYSLSSVEALLLQAESNPSVCDESRMSAILDKWEFHSLRSLLFLSFNSPPQLKVTGLESLEIISTTELNLSQIQKMYPDLVSLIIDAPHFCKDPNQRSIEFHKLQYLSITRTLRFSSCESKEQDQEEQLQQERKAQLFAAVNSLNLPSLLILDFKLQDGTYETNMDLHFPAPQLQFIKLRIMEPTFKGDDNEIDEDGYDSEIEQDSMVRGDAYKFKFQYHISNFPQLKHLFIPSLFNTIRIENCRNLETIQAYNPTYNSKLYADSLPNLSLLNISSLSQKQQKSVIRFPVSNNHRLLTLDKTTTMEDLRNNPYAKSNISAYNEDYGHSQGERKKLHVHQYKLVSQECSYSSILLRYENSLLGEYREKMRKDIPLLKKLKS